MVKFKKYLYALRPICGAIYIERALGVVPTEFDQLIDAVIDDVELRRAIDDLLKRKAAVTEGDECEPIAVIHEFVKAQIERLEKTVADIPAPRGPVKPLDEFFRETLRKVWA